MKIKNKIRLLDGAFGTMLQKKGLKTGELPELFCIKNPDIVEEIHREYIDSGSDIIYTNTFGANRYKLKDSGFSTEEVVKFAVKIAKKAAENKAYVGLDIGSMGQMLEPMGTLKFEEAYDAFKEIILAGVSENVDIIIFETMTDLYELKAGILAAKENCDLPIFATMTFEQDARTFMGCSVNEAVAVLEGLGVDALGINCSLGPNEITPIAIEISKLTELPIIVKPNAGLPDPKTGEYDISMEEFAESLAKLTDYGINMFGGCCGTTPEYISLLKKTLKGKKLDQREIIKRSVVTSSTKTVVIDGVRIIGERINPTGKKLLKEAIKNKDYNYINKQAIDQIEAGAAILDVNVGLPDINEAEFMPVIVKKLQALVDVPLQIDSSDPNAIESALRVYNGKAIVNSVNGDDEVLDKILPIVKKYGASVVGLTLDENGIPEKAIDRFKIAKKILDKAIKYGIKKEDVYIDCLTLTVSAQQEAVMETLKALQMVKEELGLKTVLGVSNISFGLPNREIINQTFLAMAITSGLDLPIINPNIKKMTDIIDAFNVLSFRDVGSTEYIKKHSDTKSEEKPVKSQISLDYAIMNGLQDEAEIAVTEALKTREEMDIIDNILIPALDSVGDKFEKGEIFLPQLLQSSQAAQKAFDKVKEKIALSNKESVSRGSIILATVKGDIHDIGKNIVKAILSNYGYNIIDLGKDVSTQTIIKALKEHKVKLLGLSALMTTTIKSMEETIKEIREQNINCKIIVGGAVMTPEYAKKIGADFYAKDAKSAIDIAQTVL